MFLTKLFALFWLIPLVVSGSCPQDQKQISVRVTAEFRLHSYIKTVDHETTITASRNFVTSFKKCRLAMKSGNSTISFGDAVKNILDTVGLAICTAEGDKIEKVDTKSNGDIKQCQNGQKIFNNEKNYIITNFLQLLRVITYSVTVEGEMAKIQEKTTVDSIPVSSAGNYGDRSKYGETYIEKLFQNETGGNIVDNTFTVSTCYNESSQQEINELTQLKEEIQTLKKRFTDLSNKFRQQNITTNMQISDLIQQNETTNMELTDLTNKFQKQNNINKMQLSGLTNKFQQQNNATNMELNRTNIQLSDLIQQDNRTNLQLTDLIQQNNRTKMQLSDLMQINKTTTMQLSDITDNVYQQNITLKQMNTTLNQMNTTLKQMNTRQLKSLKIVKAHGGLRADKCKFMCVGTTGRNSTIWGGGDGYMYIYVNMTSCGFVDAPVVTTSLEGTNYNYYMSGTAAPYRVTTVQFQIFIAGYVHSSYRLHTSKPSLSTAKSSNFNVNWAAYGYKEC